MMHLHIKQYRAIHMDTNQAYAIPDRRIHEIPCSYNEAYRTISTNHPTICPSLPSHTGNLELPVWHRNDSNASHSYVEMDEADDEFYVKAGTEDEHTYEEVA